MPGRLPLKQTGGRPNTQPSGLNIYASLFRTLSDLDKRRHSAVMVVVAGLAVLALAYLWP